MTGAAVVVSAAFVGWYASQTPNSEQLVATTEGDPPVTTVASIADEASTSSVQASRSTAPPTTSASPTSSAVAPSTTTSLNDGSDDSTAPVVPDLEVESASTTTLASAEQTTTTAPAASAPADPNIGSTEILTVWFPGEDAMTADGGTRTVNLRIVGGCLYSGTTTVLVLAGAGWTTDAVGSALHYDGIEIASDGEALAAPRSGSRLNELGEADLSQPWAAECVTGEVTHAHYVRSVHRPRPLARDLPFPALDTEPLPLSTIEGTLQIEGHCAYLEGEDGSRVLLVLVAEQGTSVEPSHIVVRGVRLEPEQLVRTEGEVWSGDSPPWRQECDYSAVWRVNTIDLQPDR